MAHCGEGMSATLSHSILTECVLVAVMQFAASFYLVAVDHNVDHRSELPHCGQPQLHKMRDLYIITVITVITLTDKAEIICAR